MSARVADSLKSIKIINFECNFNYKWFQMTKNLAAGKALSGIVN